MWIHWYQIRIQYPPARKPFNYYLENNHNVQSMFMSLTDEVLLHTYNNGNIYISYTFYLNMTLCHSAVSSTQPITDKSNYDSYDYLNIVILNTRRFPNHFFISRDVRFAVMSTVSINSSSSNEVLHMKGKNHYMIGYLVSNVFVLFVPACLSICLSVGNLISRHYFVKCGLIGLGQVLIGGGISRPLYRVPSFPSLMVLRLTPGMLHYGSICFIHNNN